MPTVIPRVARDREQGAVAEANLLVQRVRDLAAQDSTEAPINLVPRVLPDQVAQLALVVEVRKVPARKPLRVAPQVGSSFQARVPSKVANTINFANPAKVDQEGRGVLADRDVHLNKAAPAGRAQARASQVVVQSPDRATQLPDRRPRGMIGSRVVPLRTSRVWALPSLRVAIDRLFLSVWGLKVTLLRINLS
jgi:hypothetical protein